MSPENRLLEGKTDQGIYLSHPENCFGILNRLMIILMINQ